MKASELRIGNWVQLPSGKCHKINSVSIVAQEQHEAAGAVGYKPILLTEEWLLKLGFAQYSEKLGYTVKRKSGGYYLSSEYIGREFSFNVEYVHQLQNLYFALTGKELIIKL